MHPVGLRSVRCNWGDPDPRLAPSLHLELFPPRSRPGQVPLEVSHLCPATPFPTPGWTSQWRADCGLVPHLPPTALVPAGCTSGDCRGALGRVAANAMATVWSCPRFAVRRLWPTHARPPPRRLRVMAASPADASLRRRENRRQLDARRSKCRIRLGGHMEQWCLLKERLGFSLHSQLAKFLLDRYTTGCVLCSGPTPPEEAKPAPIPSTAGRSWCPQARGRQEPAGLESEHEERTQETGLPRKLGPPPEAFLPPGEKGEEEDEGEEEMLSDASPWTYSSSPDEQVGTAGGAGGGRGSWKGPGGEGRENRRQGIGWKSGVRL